MAFEVRSDTIRRVGRYNMQYYLAPMEGLTGYIYRNAHRAVFGGMDKYFTPFITPNHNRSLTSREMRDVQPEHNAPDVVPQIMANDAAAFIWAADKLAQLGYDEVNLNLGCPSRTVVTKGRGAGFLGRPTALDEFLAQVFDCVRIRVSVKARIGLSDCAELPGLINIFNRYPICELTLHARVQSAYYKGVPDLYSYERAARMANMPLAYNGDVFSPADAADIEKRFPYGQSGAWPRNTRRRAREHGRAEDVPRHADTRLYRGHERQDKRHTAHEGIVVLYGRDVPGRREAAQEAEKIQTA